MVDGTPLLQVDKLSKLYPVTRGFLLSKTVSQVHAVDGVSFHLHEGETLGLVGESGCGKSTTAKMILRLERPSAGTVHLGGKDVHSLRGKELRQYRSTVQAVFQNPQASLDPRMNVGALIAEPLQLSRRVTGREAARRVEELLAQVGLQGEHADRFPHQFSGGQLQRIAIASALAPYPKLIVLDEPVSALDVSIAAQIMNLLKDLQASTDVAFLLIAHNLQTVRYLAKKVAIMYLGQIVEWGPTEEVYDAPLHPYTKALFAAALPSHPDEPRAEIHLKGEVPSAINPPAGCRFHPRCPMAIPKCSREPPAPQLVSRKRTVSCHLVEL